MLRWFILILLSPFWFPFRALRALTTGRQKCEVLSIDLRGSLPDFPAAGGWLSRIRGSEGGPALLPLIRVLANAEKEPTLKTVIVHLHELHCGLARAEELRAALQRVRQAGKEVLVFSESFGLSGYWVALGASNIGLVPTGTVNVTGFMLEFTLLKGLLDKAGIRAQLAARGKYKSMAEMFTKDEMSAANREMLESLTQDLFRQLLSVVGAARSLSEQQVKHALEDGPLRGTQALEAGLIDRLVYPDEIRKQHEELATLTLDDYLKRQRARRWLPRRRSQVAVLSVHGNIKSGNHSPGPAGGRRATGSLEFGQAVRHLADSPRIKAVIVRVDSPGGSALASDVMWRELGCAVQSLTEANKPVVVSMVNVAASGGYYISGIKGVPIWASPTTLTGSIGVVSGKYEASALIEQLGVKRVAITSNPRAEYLSPTTPWGEVELEKLAQDTDAAYTDFVTKMCEARGMTFEQLDAVAQGRVWTGTQAKEHGLVDHLGGLFEVMQHVSQSIAVDASTLEWYSPDSRSGVSQLRKKAPENPLISLIEQQPALAQALDVWSQSLAFGNERTLALMPIQMREPH